MASVTTVHGRRCTKVRRANVTNVGPAGPAVAAVTPGPVIPLVTVPDPPAKPSTSIKVPLLVDEDDPAAMKAAGYAPKATSKEEPVGKVPEITSNPDITATVSAAVKSLLIPQAPAAAETPAAAVSVALPPPVVAPVPKAPAPAPVPAPTPAAAAPVAAAPPADKPAPQVQAQAPPVPAPVPQPAPAADVAPPPSAPQTPSNNQPAPPPAVQAVNPQPVVPEAPASAGESSNGRTAGNAAAGAGVVNSGSNKNNNSPEAAAANSGSSSGGSAPAIGNVNDASAGGSSSNKSPVIGVAAGSNPTLEGQTGQSASNQHAGAGPVVSSNLGSASGSLNQPLINVPLAQSMQAMPVLLNGTPIPQQSGQSGLKPTTAVIAVSSVMTDAQGLKTTVRTSITREVNVPTSITGPIVMTTDSSGNLNVISTNKLDDGSSSQGQDGNGSHVSAGTVAGGVSVAVVLVLIGAFLFFCVRKRGFGVKRRSLENPVTGRNRLGPRDDDMGGKLGGIMSLFKSRASRSSHYSSKPSMSQWAGAAVGGRTRSSRDRSSSAPPPSYRDQMRGMMGRRSPSESTVIYPTNRYSRHEEGPPPMLQTSILPVARRSSVSSISQGIYSTSPHDDNDDPFRDPDSQAPLRLLNPDLSRLNTPAITPGLALGSPSRNNYFPTTPSTNEPTLPNQTPRSLHRRHLSQTLQNPFSDPSADPFADPDHIRSPVSPIIGSPLSAAAAARIRLSHELQRRSSYNRRTRSVASIPSSIDEETYHHSTSPITPQTKYDRQNEQLNSLYAALSPTRVTSDPHSIQTSSFSPLQCPPTPDYDNMAHSPSPASQRTSTGSSFFNQFGPPSAASSHHHHHHFFYYNTTRPTTGAGLSDVASRVSDPFDLDRPELYSFIRSGSAASSRSGNRSEMHSPSTGRRENHGYGLGIGGVETRARETESPTLGLDERNRGSPRH